MLSLTGVWYTRPLCYNGMKGWDPKSYIKAGACPVGLFIFLKKKIAGPTTVCFWNLLQFQQVFCYVTLLFKNYKHNLSIERIMHTFGCWSGSTRPHSYTTTVVFNSDLLSECQPNLRSFPRWPQLITISLENWLSSHVPLHDGMSAVIK